MSFVEDITGWLIEWYVVHALKEHTLINILNSRYVRSEERLFPP